MITLKRQDLIYPELSYKIIGCAFDVYNSLGSGHHEKYYQRALSEAFSNQKLSFHQQVHFPLSYKGKINGSDKNNKNYFHPNFLSIAFRIFVRI
jgi:hypothetical protein